jgi:hypothetical protein
MADDGTEPDPVSVTVELSGSYDAVTEKLHVPETDGPELSAVTDDLGAVVEIVSRTGGATKSRIAEELPPGVSADFDAETVIHVLRVLELYDLVRLDGNTWRPGPALEE